MCATAFVDGLRIPWLHDVRILSRLLAACHTGLFVAAVVATVCASKACLREAVVASFITAIASAIRLIWMVGSAVIQAGVASTMIAGEEPGLVSSSATSSRTQIRKERRMWYKRWLWWGRLGVVVSLLQWTSAAFLTYFILKNVTSATELYASHCHPGAADEWEKWHYLLLLALAVVTWVLAIAQCCAGSDVLAWHSLYSRDNEAWRAYYHEVFDYGIREALWCMGRAQYMSVLDEDEVDSVAELLGELVSYRASGASHLQILAGLALLQRKSPGPLLLDQFPDAPEALVREATVLHPYAVAAYTGPLLDVGRNPLIFPCIWLYRQGMLTLWDRSRRPVLEGDNWWRGHAAAFLQHLHLPPEALRKGRVLQAKREAAYFVTVVHQLQCIIVSVRGTATPEDLLTDGLGKECTLMEPDIQGLLQNKHVPESLRQHVLSSMPHFGHEGIVEAARELALQLDNVSDVEDQGNLCTSGNAGLSAVAGCHVSQQEGLLSCLLGSGGECEGYALRFVGHSLGGSIAALAALRLCSRYPNMHVFGYGILPCVDKVIANACSSFITSIVYNHEFSSRLSLSSIARLQGAAVCALSPGVSSDLKTIPRLALQLLGSQRLSGINDSSNKNNIEFVNEGSVPTKITNFQKHRQYEYRLKGTDSRPGGVCSCEECESMVMTSENEKDGQSSNVLYHVNSEIKDTDNRSQEPIISKTINETVCLSSDYDSKRSLYIELFLPGLIIHLVPTHQQSEWLLFKGWKQHRKKYQHKAVLRERESFKDIVVSPSMFLDHMPWRCQYALNSILESMPSSEHSMTEEIV